MLSKNSLRPNSPRPKLDLVAGLVPCDGKRWRGNWIGDCRGVVLRLDVDVGLRYDGEEVCPEVVARDGSSGGII